MASARTAITVALVCALLASSVLALGRQSPTERQSVGLLLDDYLRTGTIRPLTFQTPERFMGALDAVVPGWIASAPNGDADRRRNSVALLLLEHVDSHRLEFSRDDVLLIDWAGRLLRRSDASEFERLWTLASYSIMELSRAKQGQLNPAIADFVNRAAARFPGEPRLRLVQLLLRRETVTLSNRPGADPGRLTMDGLSWTGDLQTPGIRRVRRTVRDLEALATDPLVGSEARAHLGLVRFHLNELTASTSDLMAALETTRDPFVRNFASLIAGLAFEAQGQPQEAMRAYRNAAEAIPGARASATALAARLFLAGQRAEAFDLVERAVRVDPPAPDPWQHVAAEVRFLRDRMSRLRALIGLPAAPADGSIAPLTPGAPANSLPAPTARAEVAFPSPVTAETILSQSTGFRSTTASVAVDVSVRQRNAPVAGLTAADFELLDNGVPQRIADVSIQALPIDLSLVADMSQPSQTNPGRVPYTVTQHAQIKADLLQIPRLLGDADRLRVVIVEGQPIEVVPLQPARAALPADRLQSRLNSSYGRTSALYDATVVTLMRVTPPDRRHLVVAFTDAVDDASVTPAAVLAAIANQTDALLYVARRQSNAERDPRLAAKFFDPSLWPPDPEVLEQAARATGGQVLFTSSMLDDVRRILATFRQRYVLHYQPTGVAREGLHTITVRVTAPGRYDVEARRGYFGGR